MITLKHKAKIVKIKSHMSNVPGNNFNPCATSTIEPKIIGGSNQYLPILNSSFHKIKKDDEKE